MCGRYELHTHPAALALVFGLPFPDGLVPRYNIAPTQDVLVVRRNAEGARELATMRWGLVPRWARDPSIGTRMINARAETVATSAAFRWPFAHHRVLVPADGFYEWAAREGGKQPLHVARRDGAPLAFAGLAERWMSSDGEVVDSCSIVTTGANATLRPWHTRMPAIVAPGDFERWLDAAADPSPRDLLAPAPDDLLAVVRVSTRVNATRNDDASLIAPLDDASLIAPLDDDLFA